MLRLARVGAAAFLDVGRAWATGIESRAEDPGAGLLSDVGIGLRVSPSRSSRGSVLHLDVAFPLAGGSSISSTQFLISTRHGF